MNKEHLEKQGYVFEKIGESEYLDLTKTKKIKVINCPAEKIILMERQLSSKLKNIADKRGKALSVILPLINQGQATNLFSELYDLREEHEKREIEDAIAEEEMIEDLGIVNEFLGDILNELKDKEKEKCRPKKNQPKKPQPKKKVAVKKK